MLLPPTFFRCAISAVSGVGVRSGKLAQHMRRPSSVAEFRQKTEFQ
jgi:hypothetical protein